MKGNATKLIYCVNAGYEQGHTGQDHMLPKHHSSMVGRVYPSLEHAQADLNGRTEHSICAPAFAEIIVAVVNRHLVVSAIEIERDRCRRSSQPEGAARMQRLLDHLEEAIVHVDANGSVMVSYEPAGWNVRRDEAHLLLGSVRQHQYTRHTLTA